MSFNNKITDLKFHVDNLVAKDICKYFIDVYENNSKHAYTDNFKCIDLTKLSLEDKNFIKPLNLAKKYISIMITNYVLHIQKTICPTFTNNLIANSHNVRILKYDKGQFIKDHCDVNGSIRASCTLNLNEDYEGGEFRFFNGQIKHSFKTGDAMIFPAEPIWIHGTEPITKGTRYSINCFLHS